METESAYLFHVEPTDDWALAESVKGCREMECINGCIPLICWVAFILDSLQKHVLVPDTT